VNEPCLGVLKHFFDIAPPMPQVSTVWYGREMWHCCLQKLEAIKASYVYRSRTSIYRKKNRHSESVSNGRGKDRINTIIETNPPGHGGKRLTKSFMNL
jgi:hypothetical protein